MPAVGSKSCPRVLEASTLVVLKNGGQIEWQQAIQEFYKQCKQRRKIFSRGKKLVEALRKVSQTLKVEICTRF